MIEDIFSIESNANIVANYGKNNSVNEPIKEEMIRKVAEDRHIPLEVARKKFVVITKIQYPYIVGYELASRYVYETEELYRI